MPTYREGFVTDQGNHIIDVKNLKINNPKELEIKINSIPGVVDNGIFSINKPDKVIVAE